MRLVRALKLTLSVILLPACGGVVPVERAGAPGQPTPAAPAPHEDDGVARVQVQELRDALQQGKAIAVDVRPPEQYRARAIKGAMYIQDVLGWSPAGERARGKLIVTYCA